MTPSSLASDARSELVPHDTKLATEAGIVRATIPPSISLLNPSGNFHDAT